VHLLDEEAAAEAEAKAAADAEAKEAAEAEAKVAADAEAKEAEVATAEAVTVPINLRACSLSLIFLICATMVLDCTRPLIISKVCQLPSISICHG
jgi:hypothetical protein